MFNLSEFHSDFYIGRNLFYLRKTRKVKFNFAWKPWNLLKEITFYRKQRKEPTLIKTALSRVNYFAHYIYFDFKLIQSKGLMLDTKYLQFHYGSIFEFVNEWKSFKKVNRNNILIGNSASLSNNHISLLHTLAKFKTDCKVICPLSYSGENDYVSEVVELGITLFGNKFTPLHNYYPRNEYCEIIYSCSHVIMGHLRSEGCGNVFRALAYGSKVFLDEKNLFYEFLKQKKFIIFSHNQLSDKELNTQLSVEEIELNRKLLLKYFNEDLLINQYNNLLKI